MSDTMPADNQAAANSSGDFSPWRNDGRPKVLLIEDNPGHRVMIANELRDLGYDVAECGSLNAVQVFVTTLMTPPVGILLDLRIPLGSGTNANLQNGRDCGLFLRAQVVTQKAPIVAYTNHSEDVRLPGWDDIIGFSAILKKNEDSIPKFDETLKNYFR